MKDVVTACMGEAGYAIAPSKANGSMGVLRQGGEAMDIRFLEQPGSPPETIRQIQLSLEIDTGRVLPPADAQFFEAGLAGFRRPYNPSDATETVISVTPHLGETATVRGQITFRRFEPNDLIEQFGRVWSATRLLAKSRGSSFEPAPLRDWTKAAFPDSIRVGEFESVGFSRLVDAWGWHATPSHGFSGAPFAVEASVSGRRLWMYTHPGLPAPSPVLMDLRAHMSPPKGTDRAKWVARLRRQWPSLHWCLSGREGVSVTRWVSFEPAMNLRTLRGTILAFATRVDRIARP